MSHSRQGDKALRIDTKWMNSEANEGGGDLRHSCGPYRPPARPAGIAKDDDSSRLTTGPKPSSPLGGPPEAGRRTPKTINDAHLHFKAAIACRNMWFMDRDTKKLQICWIGSREITNGQ